MTITSDHAIDPEQIGSQYLSDDFTTDSMIEVMVFELVKFYDFDWDISRTGEDYTDADLWEWAMELADRYEVEGE
jgi:hypothetical protein